MMDEREALARLVDPESFAPVDCCDLCELEREAAFVIADRILAAGYGLRTQAWEQGRDAAADCMDDAEAPWAAKRIRALTPPNQMQRTLSPAAQSEGGE